MTNNRLVENLPLCIAIHVADLLVGAAEGRSDLDAAVIRNYRSIVLANIKADEPVVAVSSATNFDGRACGRVCAIKYKDNT